MKISIIGCAGRMGRALINEVISNKNTELAGGLEHSESIYLGKDLGMLAGRDPVGILVSDKISKVLSKADAVINFTTPDATIDVARIAAEKSKIQVIGTTGLSDKQKSELKNLAKKSVIVHAHNMSVGVNLLLALVKDVASKLPADQFDIEIVEMHHNRKIDAPSGTALSLGEAAANGRGVKLSKVACKSRDGNIGARKPGEIGFATLRGGGVVGDHTVIFASEHERVEITHKAQDRSVFASGAVRAALWAKGKKPGLYSMSNVLGL